MTDSCKGSGKKIPYRRWTEAVKGIYFNVSWCCYIAICQPASKNSSYDKIVNATITPYFLFYFSEGKKKSVNLGIIFKKSYILGICIKFWEGSSPISLGSALRIIWLTRVVLICRIFPFSQKKLFQCTDHSPVGSNISWLPGAPWVHYFAKKYTPNQSCLLTFTYPEWRTAHQLWKNCKENKLFVSWLPPAPVAVPGGKCWNISSWLCLA